MGGVAFGPELSLANATIRVLGKDTAAPKFVMPTKLHRKSKEMRPDPPNWQHTDGAPFIILLDEKGGRSKMLFDFLGVVAV